MIFVTPFYPGLTNYGKFADAVKKQGQCDGHTLLVITQRQDEEAATAFVKKLEKLFAKAEVRIVEAVRGNIPLANAFFKEAINFFRQRKAEPNVQHELPMLYSDPTWVPVKPGWLNTIQGEYFSSGMPKVIARWEVDEIGDKITFGPILLSREYANEAPLVPSIPNSTHWRRYLRHELGNVAVAARTISNGEDSVLQPAPTKK